MFEQVDQAVQTVGGLNFFTLSSVCIIISSFVQNKYTILYYFTYFHVRNVVMEHNSLVRDIHHLPLLLMFVERYNVTLIIGRILISSIAKDKLAEAVQAYYGIVLLAGHRLSSIPRTWPDDATFQDKNAPMDLCGNFNKTLELYRDFKD